MYCFIFGLFSKLNKIYGEPIKPSSILLQKRSLIEGVSFAILLYLVVKFKCSVN